MAKDKIKVTKTPRGFGYAEFTDGNGVECSIQESSAVRDEGDALLWLGANDIGLKKFDPANGGWKDVPLEQNAPNGVSHTANTRMHLTQSQVAALLPLLKRFAKTGRLPR